MSRFHAYEGFTSADLAIFEQAFEDACRKLGPDPSPADDTVYQSLRDDSATAIMNAARFGERDPSNLSAFAISFGLRNCHLPKRFSGAVTRSAI
jgi:hypothetical protein